MLTFIMVELQSNHISTIVDLLVISNLKQNQAYSTCAELSTKGINSTHQGTQQQYAALVVVIYLVLTGMSGDSYCGRFRSLLLRPSTV